MTASVAAEAPSAAPRAPLVVQYLDMIVLVLALAVFIAADLPILGWVGTAVSWTLARALQLYMLHQAAEETDHRRFFGLMAASLIGKTWLVLAGVLVVGLIDRPSGLPAVLLALIVFTIYLVTSMAHRPGTARSTERAV